MKKIKKFVLIGLILLVVLGLVAVILAGIFLDPIVKTGIVTVAPIITQTTVSLDAVHISMLNGSVGLDNFVVGNPTGYQTPWAVSVGKVAVKVAPATLLADKIVVHSIAVQAPEVTFEGNPFGDNNLKKIMANVNSVTASTDQTAASPAQPAKSQGAAKKLQIDDLLISGIQIHASLTGVSSVPGLEGKVFTLPIPDIHFTQLGTGPDGITAADLTQKILSQITTETIQAVGDAVKKLANGAIKGASAGAQKALGSGTDSIKKGLGGLFGK